MSISIVRSRLDPTSKGLRSLLLALAAVIAVLLGLLAMHSLNIEPTHGATTMEMSAPASQHAEVMPSDLDPTGLAVCDNACGQTHVMAALACILGMLIVTLFWGAGRSVIRSQARLWLAALPARLAGLPTRSPPSLHVLSISRT